MTGDRTPRRPPPAILSVRTTIVRTGISPDAAPPHPDSDRQPAGRFRPTQPSTVTAGHGLLTCVGTASLPAPAGRWRPGRRPGRYRPRARRSHPPSPLGGRARVELPGRGRQLPRMPGRAGPAPAGSPGRRCWTGPSRPAFPGPDFRPPSPSGGTCRSTRRSGPAASGSTRRSRSGGTWTAAGRTPASSPTAGSGGSSRGPSAAHQRRFQSTHPADRVIDRSGKRSLALLGGSVMVRQQQGSPPGGGDPRGGR